MSAVAAYRRALHARRAAALGITVEDYLRRLDNEAAEQRRINELVTSGHAQWAVIARHARGHGRLFSRHQIAA
jgi:hypothetical protein